MKKILLLALLLLGSPALAASHHYTCADTFSYSSASCTSTDTFTFPGGSSAATNTGHDFTFVDGGTYYLSYTTDLVGTDSNDEPRLSGDGGTTQFSRWAGPRTVLEESITIGANGPNTTLVLKTASFSAGGTVNDVCIDDDGTSCSPAPPGPGPCDGFMGLICSSESVFQGSTGTTLGAGVGWAGSTLTLPFLGAGLAFFLAIKGWLLAFIILNLIIYFAYRAWVFFRH